MRKIVVLLVAAVLLAGLLSGFGAKSYAVEGSIAVLLPDAASSAR